MFMTGKPHAKHEPAIINFKMFKTLLTAKLLVSGSWFHFSFDEIDVIHFEIDVIFFLVKSREWKIVVDLISRARGPRPRFLS